MNNGEAFMDDEIKVKSLQKALRVLECFLEHKEMGISEIALSLACANPQFTNIVSTFETRLFAGKIRIPAATLLG